MDYVSGAWIGGKVMSPVPVSIPFLLLIQYISVPVMYELDFILEPKQLTTKLSSFDIIERSDRCDICFRRPASNLETCF